MMTTLGRPLLAGSGFAVLLGTSDVGVGSGGITFDAVGVEIVERVVGLVMVCTGAVEVRMIVSTQ